MYTQHQTGMAWGQRVWNEAVKERVHDIRLAWHGDEGVR